MSENALVSILIPAYKSTFFETALLSALGQSWKECEIVVCDDSSDDSIRLICEKYLATSHIPIRYFKNSAQLYEPGNCARCIQEARGIYVKFLYDDDVLESRCVERLVEALETDASIRLASSRRRRIDEAGTLLPDIAATAFPFEQDVVLRGEDVVSFLADYLINFIGEPSVVMGYREDFLPYGDGIFSLKEEKMFYLGDVALYVKVLQKGDLAFLCEPLSAFRISAGQTSQMASSEQEKVNRSYRRLPELIREFGWYKGDKTQNQMLQVAKLASEPQFHQENILHNISRALHHAASEYQSQQLREWLAARTLSPQHVALAHAWQHARGVKATLCVVVLHTGDDAALARSLNSIQAWEGFGLRLSPLIVGEPPHNSEPSFPSIVAGELDVVTGINRYLSEGQFPWVMILEAGETLLTSGLLSFDFALDSAGGCDAIYFDGVKCEGETIVGTQLRPDFNLDLLLSNPAGMARHWVFNCETLLSLNGFNRMYRKAWQFDYIVRLIEHRGIQCAGHLAEPLVAAHNTTRIPVEEEKSILRNHLRQRGYPRAEVESPQAGIYALRYHHAEQPLVSIIIPTKDQLAVLIPCITTLLEKTRYKHYELLIVDNNSETPEALEWLNAVATIDPQRIRVLRYPHPFNYSAINNMAAREARGEYLVLLNNDTAIIEENWLDHLLNHGQRPEVGIVGAKLLYPGGNIQHAGVVMGLRGPADHPFINSTPDKPGYMHRLQTDQNYSVVTAACLLIRKSVYQQVGGLDEERFRVSYNDVDLCLKVRDAGYLTVWTPYAVVMHEGSVSQKTVDKATQEKKRQRFTGEQDAMYQKWLPIIANDPAYNPNLSLNNAGFQLQLDATGTWDPLHWKPLPTLLILPQDRSLAASRRLIDEMDLLDNAAMARVLLPLAPPSIGEMARIAPTSLVLQQIFTPAAQEWLERLRKATGQFTVFVLDDIVDVDSQAGLKAMLRHVDRLVVPSKALADACSGWHHDIRIVPPRLSPQKWQRPGGPRQPHAKPRIGWVGDSTTAADLDIVHHAIKQLADSVDWVLLGYCPPSLRDDVAEHHAGVSAEHYPQKLAGLNLDLVIEPLADTLLNRHRNTARVLEFGACGYPVICSDTAALPESVPVTRVKNSTKSWVEAIVQHLETPQAAHQDGDSLSAWVTREGMLTESALHEQLRIWLRD